MKKIRKLNRLGKIRRGWKIIEIETKKREKTERKPEMQHKDKQQNKHRNTHTHT